MAEDMVCSCWIARSRDLIARRERGLLSERNLLETFLSQVARRRIAGAMSLL